MNLNIHKKRKIFKRSFALFFFFTAIFLIASAEISHAFDLKSWYLNNRYLLEQGSLFSDIIRSISFLVTKLLVTLSSFSESLYDTAFGFIDLTTNKVVSDFIDKFKPYLIGLLALSIIYYGVILITNSEKRPKIIDNIALLILVVTTSTIVFAAANSLIKTFKADIDSIKITEAKSMTYSAVNANVIDLVRLSSKNNGLDKIDYKSASSEEKATLMGAGITDEQSFSLMDYTQRLNPDSSNYTYAREGRTKEILSNYLFTIDAQSKKFITQSVDNGWGWNEEDDNDFGNTFYYRYKMDSLNLWINLLAICIIYFTMSYKIIKIEYELIVAKYLSVFYAADIAGGEKLKKILSFIKDNYILIAVSLFSVKVFQILTVYTAANFTGITKSFFILFIAFIAIDGPNIAEKILGIDAGLKSSTARLMGLGYAAASAGKLLKGAGSKMSSGIFGEKTKAPMPADGKRHGGILDKLNGTSAKAKAIGKKAFEDAAANAAASGSGKEDAGSNEPAGSGNADIAGSASTKANEAANKNQLHQDISDAGASKDAVSGAASAEKGDSYSGTGYNKTREKHSFMNEKKPQKKSAVSEYTPKNKKNFLKDKK